MALKKLVEDVHIKINDALKKYENTSFRKDFLINNHSILIIFFLFKIIPRDYDKHVRTKINIHFFLFCGLK